MWLAFYNQAAVGDVLLLTRASIAKNLIVSESNKQVTLIKNEQNNEVIGVNIFNISEFFNIEENGQVFLTEQQVNVVNDIIKAAGFDTEIEVDNSPKFVVGYVQSSEKVADSDHLTVTQTQVGENETLQIVCGAANISSGQHVLVAKPGAVMPSGMIIWSGELRGVESHGMICSTRELGLEELEELPGIWELRPDFTVGTPLAEVIANY